MCIVLTPKYPFRFLTLFPPLSQSNLKWASTSSFKTPQFVNNPNYHIIHFFNSIKTQKDQTHRPNSHIKDYQFALISALKSCSSIVSGKQIHCLTIKIGVQYNLFVQNSLMNMYAKCGQLEDAKLLFDSCLMLDSVSYNVMICGYVRFRRLDDARHVFDEMPQKGCVAYTTMIMGFAQNDRFGEAIRIFKDMRAVGVIPNEVTMSSVISSYSHFGRNLDAKMLHGLTFKLGLVGFVLVCTNLMHVYCVCCDLCDARSLFDEMHEKNIVSWNVMLNGYSKAGLIDLGREIFERIPEKDVVSCGTMIDAYVQANRFRDALMVYRAMLGAGMNPNDILMVDLVYACGQEIAFDEGQQLHGVILKTGLDCYDSIQSTIIHFYAACCKIDLACVQFEAANKDHILSWNALVSGFIRNEMTGQARKLFNEMPERDVSSWSSMISGYSQYGQPGMALELFDDMVLTDIQPNEITMVSVLSAIGSLGVLKEGRSAHEYIRKNSIPLTDNLSAVLIDMYAKCGSIGTSFEIFNQDREKFTSVSPWNAIICGLAVHGHTELSLETFNHLQKTKIQPNSITFIGVLTACCHGGLVEAGKEYFRSMKTLHEIEPNIKHYGCMVDLLGRAGRIKEAEEVIASMPMEADTVIWGTLLAACRTHGYVEIGERAAERLANLDKCHGGSRVLLSNLYADAGRWNDAIAVRSLIQSSRMMRSPGCSDVV